MRTLQNTHRFDRLQRLHSYMCTKIMFQRTKFATTLCGKNKIYVLKKYIKFI